MKSYLNDRYKTVLIKNTNSKNYPSEWEKVKCGLPQRSINSLSKPTLFADDTYIIFTQSNLTEFKEEIN